MSFDPRGPDVDFLAAFEATEISPDLWDHRCHIRMAWLFLRRYPLEEAVSRVRSGLQRINARHHVPDALDRGFHETMTWAWMRLVDATIRHFGPCGDSQTFCEAQPHLLSKSLLRLYYTRERLLTREAKARFVEPDIAPLPRPCE